MMKITSLGSGKIFDLEELRCPVLVDGYIVDPRNGTLMEMDAINLVYGYLFLGFSGHANDVLKAVLNNLNESGKFWVHNAWGFEETHYRFTSSALRLLHSKYAQDNKFTDIELLSNLAKQQFDFHENIEGGIWFLHDSIEFDKVIYPHAHIISNTIGSSVYNMLIINTHLDTLTTLLFIKHVTGEHEFNSTLELALGGLDSFLASTSMLPKHFEFLDSKARNLLMYLGRFKAKPFQLVRKIFSRGYYRFIRKHYKKKYNIFSFKDGFTERDICLIGPSFNYHVVNIWDISKTLFWLRVTNSESNLKEIEKLREIYLSGLMYCFSSDYFAFIKQNKQCASLYNQLLESMVLGFSLGILDVLHLKYFYSILGVYPNSNGVIGADPTISGNNVLEYMNLEPSLKERTFSCIKLATGETFIIMKPCTKLCEIDLFEKLIAGDENIMPCKVLTLDKVFSFPC